MKRLLDIVKRLLREGLSPRRIAAGVALGVTLGIFPIYGPVSLIAIALAWALGLNKPLVLAGCYSMTFVKPLLILPYLRLGEWVFRAEPMEISLVELTRRFSASPLDTLREFGWSFLHAMAGWAVTVPVLMLGLYAATLLVIRRWQAARAISTACSPRERGATDSAESWSV